MPMADVCSMLSPFLSPLHKIDVNSDSDERETLSVKYKFEMENLLDLCLLKKLYSISI